MSGIFGYSDPRNELPAGIAERMAEALTLSSERKCALHHTDGACIGVVDKGTFPGASGVLHNSGTDRRAVFQGEIVAYSNEKDELEPSTRARELFCQPLSEDKLSRAVGPFTAAILDENAKSIELVEDRYGWYLLYYARYGDAVLFASQCKALLASGVVSSEMNEDALALMMSIGEVVGDLTLFRHIRALPAGSITRLQDGTLTTHRYWQYNFKEDNTLDFAASADRAVDLFQQAVHRTCRSGRATGVPLSGGLDSRITLASTPNPSQIPSYTWGIEGCRDLRYARQTAESLNSPHHAFVYDPAYIAEYGQRGVWLTEGFCDTTDMHVLPYVQTCANDCDVLLDAMAGDAVLGGNFINRKWWNSSNTAQAAKHLWNWRFGMLSPETGEALLGRERYQWTVERARQLFCDQYALYEAPTEMDRTMAFLLDNRVRRCSSNGAYLFRWQAEMHFPFFDNEFFDFVMQVPYRWRHRHKLYVEMLRRQYPAMAHIPWQRTGLPAGTRWPLRFFAAAAGKVNEKAERFSFWPDLFPGRHVARFDQWFRGPLQGFVDKTLLSEKCLDRGFLKAEGLRKIVHEHNNGANHQKLIGVLSSLELFQQLFVDDLAKAEQQFCSPPSFTKSNYTTTATDRVHQ
jgi:asparagine synthase (glutamine-hydrolysing)